MKRARFDVYQDAARLWRWRFIAPNGRIMADSGEGYSTRAKAWRAAWRTVALMGTLS